MKRQFQGTIRDGRLDQIPIQLLNEWIGRRTDGAVVLVVLTGADIIDKKRSNPQNNFYWGVVVPQLLYAMLEAGDNSIEDFARRENEPKLIDALHEWLLERFAGREVVDLETGEVVYLPRRTTKMSTKQMSLYCEKIRLFCAEEYGAEIPLPNDDLFAE